MNTQDLRFAQFYARVVARLIDVTIISMIVWPLTHTYNDEANSALSYYNYPNGSESAYGLILFYLFYYPILEATGGTLGKRFLSIRSISSGTFKHISFVQAYKRSLFLFWPIGMTAIMFMFSDLTGVFPYRVTMFLAVLSVLFSVIGPLAVLWTKQKQEWHDSWTNTYVISASTGK